MFMLYAILAGLLAGWLLGGTLQTWARCASAGRRWRWQDC